MSQTLDHICLIKEVDRGHFIGKVVIIIALYHRIVTDRDSKMTISFLFFRRGCLVG